MNNRIEEVVEEIFERIDREFLIKYYGRYAKDFHMVDKARWEELKKEFEK